VTLSISKEERNGEYKAYLKEETTSCLLDNHRGKLYVLHKCLTAEITENAGIVKIKRK
jgi:hypothetical protein